MHHVQNTFPVGDGIFYYFLMRKTNFREESLIAVPGFRNYFENNPVGHVAFWANDQHNNAHTLAKANGSICLLYTLPFAFARKYSLYTLHSAYGVQLFILTL